MLEIAMLIELVSWAQQSANPQQNRGQVTLRLISASTWIVASKLKCSLRSLLRREDRLGRRGLVAFGYDSEGSGVWSHHLEISPWSRPVYLTEHYSQHHPVHSQRGSARTPIWDKHSRIQSEWPQLLRLVIRFLRNRVNLEVHVNKGREFNGQWTSLDLLALT